MLTPFLTKTYFKALPLINLTHVWIRFTPYWTLIAFCHLWCITFFSSWKWNCDNWKSSTNYFPKMLWVTLSVKSFKVFITIAFFPSYKLSQSDLFLLYSAYSLDKKYYKTSSLEILPKVFPIYFPVVSRTFYWIVN